MQFKRRNVIVLKIAKLDTINKDSKMHSPEKRLADETLIILKREDFWAAHIKQY